MVTSGTCTQQIACQVGYGSCLRSLLDVECICHGSRCEDNATARWNGIAIGKGLQLYLIVLHLLHIPSLGAGRHQSIKRRTKGGDTHHSREAFGRQSGYIHMGRLGCIIECNPAAKGVGIPAVDPCAVTLHIHMYLVGSPRQLRQVDGMTC